MDGLWQVVGCALADVMVACGMQPSKAAVRRMIKVRAKCRLQGDTLQGLCFLAWDACCLECLPADQPNTEWGSTPP